MKSIMKFNGYYLLVFCVILASCGASKKGYQVKNLDPYAWMLGIWQIDNGDEFESWARTSETLYQGEAYTYNRQTKKKIVEEKVRLEFTKKKKITYTPTLTEEGKILSTIFTQINSSTDTLIFENLQHDFPKRIVYMRLTNSSGKAYIEDAQPGQGRKEFNLRKIKGQ